MNSYSTSSLHHRQLLLGAFLIINHSPQLHYQVTASHLSVFSNLNGKITTLVLIFAPVLFLPVFGKKWLLPIAPFVLILFTSNSPIYMYPYLFHLQYPSMFIPFTFIADIYGAKNLLNRNSLTNFIRNLVNPYKRK